MAKSIDPNEKSKRGRPPADTEQVGIRFSVEALRRIDDWRRQQPDMPIRTEAIRRLVEQALAGGAAPDPDAGFMTLATDLWQHMGDDVDDDSRAQINAVLAERPAPFATSEQGREWLEARLLNEFEAASRKRPSRRR